MKRAMICAVFSALAACSESLPPPHTLIGRFAQAHVAARDEPAWRAIVGDWTHEYRPDGHLIVQETGGLRIDTLYRLDGDILTLNDLSGSGSCRHQGIDVGSARYRIRFFDRGIRYEALRDECSGRRTGMTIHPWLRVR